MNPIITELRLALQNQADPETLKNGQRFFKENINTYGVKVPVVRQIAKTFSPDKLPKEDIWNLCEILWQSGNMEESIVACNWSYTIRKKYTEDDFIVFEKWINLYVNNWASCDTLCNHNVGTLLEMYPFLVNQLIGWTASENRWMKRAAAVSLIIPARRGLFLDDILKIADALLLDADDLVQKGYGWMLKAASEKHLDEVFDFVMKRKDKMPRTALRYAIEKMPEELKKQAMQK
jgi:3-methyladenine DNA glycosylase AlkD